MTYPENIRAATTERVRMNDYVGPPVFADVTWSGPCTGESGRHTLGLLSHACVRCHHKPIIRYLPAHHIREESR